MAEEGDIPEPPSFDIEQLLAVSTARDGAIEWLNRKQLGGLNYTPKQIGEVNRALEDVRSVFEGGYAHRSSKSPDSRYPYWVELRGEGGSKVEMAISK
jgi:prenyltransferase beta subunit